MMRLDLYQTCCASLFYTQYNKPQHQCGALSVKGPKDYSLRRDDFFAVSLIREADVRNEVAATKLQLEEANKKLQELEEAFTTAHAYLSDLSRVYRASLNELNVRFASMK